MAEKYSPDVEKNSTDMIETVGRGSIHLGEAAEMYGDKHMAETYGYIARGLKSRHIQFIGLGGSIGTGLFLSIGRALAATGPLSVVLGFAISGAAVFGMMQCLGEMTTWLPLPGAAPTFASRYVDSALGFAVGWMGWYSYAIAICIEVSAAAVVIQYWNSSINVAVWITIIVAVIIFLNIFAVSIYGEAEFWFAALKVVTIIGLLILALVLDLGGGPNNDRIGFRYWKDPGPMATFMAPGNKGRFWGLLFGIIIAVSIYAGVESVVVAAGEAQDPRRTLTKAVRRAFWRILFFYVIGSLAIGVLVPYNDINLLTAIVTNSPGAGSSPLFIAIQRAGIPALPPILNAVILTSASSAANACLYNGSRYLLSMAQSGLAPKIFLTCSKGKLRHLFWDTVNCLVRREIPIMRYQTTDPHAIDRMAGLCTTLLPILYDLCVAIHDKCHIDMLALEEAEYRLTSWTPLVPPDLVTSFSCQEILGMRTQASMYRNVGLLVAHRIRNAIGKMDDTAKLFATSIMLEFSRYSTSVSPDTRLQNVAFPILIASTELPNISEAWKATTLASVAPICVAKILPWLNMYGQRGLMVLQVHA